VNEPDRQLRDLLEAAVGEPPYQVSVEAVRRRVIRRRAVAWIAVAAAVVVVAVLVPTGIRALGHAPPPAGQQRSATVYVALQGSLGDTSGIVIPINTATNTPGKPIRVGGHPDAIAVAPDGKSVYVANGTSGTVIPISTATNAPGKPIRVGPHPGTATNTPGKPIRVGGFSDAIAVAPDGKTAYVANDTSGTVIPINTATNTPGKPIHVSPHPGAVGFTQGGTAYAIAVAPDGKSVYVANGILGTVIPINTATDVPGQPIRIGSDVTIAIAPDGKTAYAATWGKVIPINMATNAPGQPIRVGGHPDAIAVAP
jgi:YVTN family beta-propeller protein